MKTTTRIKISRITVIILVIIAAYLCLCLAHGMQYDRNIYCCRHMSSDLEDTIESIGIPVEIVVGYTKPDAHMWIRIAGIDIDSVYLIPYPNSAIYKYNQTVYDDYNDYQAYMNKAINDYQVYMNRTIIEWL